MYRFKKCGALLLSVLMLLSLLAGCGEKPAQGSAVQPSGSASAGTSASTSAGTSSGTTSADQPAHTPAEFSVAALKGPTAMGLVKLMDTAKNGGETANDYTFTLAASADEVNPKLIKGELDMACVPANVASLLCSKTNGAVQVLAVNTLGVIYIVENGEQIKSIQDLSGKTVVASGKGATPEYGLMYLLEEYGVKDVNIEWKSEHAECVAALASGAATIAMLPQPFVTVAGNKIPGLRTALDLTEEWANLKNGSAMLTGVIVARKEVVEKNPAAVGAFLKEYAASVEWVNGNVKDAAALIGGLGIVDAAVAEKALPHCNIVCITGSEMKEKLSGYLEVLYEQNAAAVGGALPGEDFYYGA